MRKEYSEKGLRKTALKADPIQQFQQWFDEAVNSNIEEPNAFTLGTIRQDNFPCNRTLLLKSFDSRGFVFYTNYGSRKAQDITLNPNVSLLFLWLPLNRQIQVLGRAEKLSSEASASYFKTRPRESQIGAWASPQSQVVPNRAFLDDRFDQFEQKFKDHPIDLPDNWGGYCITPIAFEFWQGRNKRLHDRFQYRLDDKGNWIIERLAP